MKVVQVNGTNIDQVILQAVESLSLGGMIIYPTETAYGLGVDATNQEAVNKLMSYKGGRKGQPVSVAVANERMASKYVRLNDTAKHLYSEFLPGPVTVISEGLCQVAVGIESKQGTLGIRIPDHEIALALIKAYGKPITATSANTSGKKTPYSLEDLEQYTSKKRLSLVDIFIDAGNLNGAPPSTVVDTTMNEVEVVRQGAIKILDGEKRLSYSSVETEAIGVEIVDKYVEKLKSYPLVIALQGELGTGKTQLVKGVAKKLEVTELVVSPTYQIMRQYEYVCGKLRGKLVHIDTWRLDKPEELNDWHVDNLLTPGNVVAIEWLEKVNNVVKIWEKQALVVWVTLEGVGDEKRQIEYVATGQGV